MLSSEFFFSGGFFFFFFFFAASQPGQIWVYQVAFKFGIGKFDMVSDEPTTKYIYFISRNGMHAMQATT